MCKYNGQELTYSIEDNGYTIYLGGRAWMSQHEPHIPNHALSYEENAIAQIEAIVAGEKETKNIEELAEDVTTLQSDVEELTDYSADLLYEICLLQLGLSE